MAEEKRLQRRVKADATELRWSGQLLLNFTAAQKFIDDLQTDLNYAKECAYGTEDVRVLIECSHDEDDEDDGDSEFTATAYYLRQENDAEYNKRIADEKALEERIKLREAEQIEYLKKSYERIGATLKEKGVL